MPMMIVMVMKPIMRMRIMMIALVFILEIFQNIMCTQNFKWILYIIISLRASLSVIHIFTNEKKMYAQNLEHKK